MSKEPNLQRMSKEEIDEIKIDAYMSKEQTPIEGIVERYTEGNYLISETAKSEMVKELSNYLNAKVLEALEREFNIAFMNYVEELSDKTFYELGGIQGLIKHYYETEVKPKYNVK